MRLYSLTGATGVDDPESGHFGRGPDGGFDLPDPLAARLHHMAIGGERLWEDSIERRRRLLAEEAARRADPATLLDAVEKLVRQAEAAPDPAPAAKPAAAKTVRATARTGGAKP